MAVLSQDIAMQSQQLQHIMLRIHQYRVHIMYRYGPDLYTVDSCVPEKLDRKQGPGGHRDKQKCKCHQYIRKYASIHIHRRYTGSNMKRHPSAKAKKYIIQSWLHKKEEVEYSIIQYLPVMMHTGNDLWHHDKG